MKQVKHILALMLIMLTITGLFTINAAAASSCRGEAIVQANNNRRGWSTGFCSEIRKVKGGSALTIYPTPDTNNYFYNDWCKTRFTVNIYTTSGKYVTTKRVSPGCKSHAIKMPGISWNKYTVQIIATYEGTGVARRVNMSRFTYTIGYN